MPGVSIARQNGTEAADVDAALDEVCFFDDYETERLFEGQRLTVAATRYDGYPIQSYETDDHLVVLEGHIYDVDDTHTHLRKLSQWIADEDEEAIRQWTRARDGDFLAFVVDRESESFTVVPDALGRLPLYHARVGETVVVSRELKFVRSMAAILGVEQPVDDLGVAQTLLLGYRIGTRTLFDAVERLPPASVLCVDQDRSVKRLFHHDFGTTAHDDRSMKENAAALAERFETAIENRRGLTETDLLALSGGLDSRAVAAGFEATDTDYVAATFDRPDGSASDEVRAAEAVTDALDVDWQQYVARNTDEHRETLLELKQGMNYLRLSFLVDFLEQLDPPRGQATYVTGDGGDKAFPDMRPPREFTDQADLVDYAISANSIFDPAEAAAIAGVSESALRRSIEQQVASYPEADLQDRYIHFLIRERGMNWLYQGEDRNRYYYWSVSPFYAQPFFRYAMNVPADQKGPSDLYEQFFRELAPELIDIEYVNFGAPITSAEYRLKRFVYDSLSRYPPLQDAVVDIVKRVNGDGTVSAPEAVDAIASQVDGSDATEGSLSKHAVEDVLGDPEGYSEPEMYHLLTVATVVNRQPAN